MKPLGTAEGIYKKGRAHPWHAHHERLRRERKIVNRARRRALAARLRREGE